CPTGALESAHLSDVQWLAGLATLEAVSEPQRRVEVRCEHAQSSGGPEALDHVSLAVSCIAEIGWHHLFTGLAALGSPVDLVCPNHSCKHYPSASLALAKAAKIGYAWQASYEVSEDYDPRRISERWPRLMDSVTHCMPYIDQDTWNSSPEAILGWQVSLEVEHDACTLCGGCAHVCPTKAFTLQWDDDQARLLFDATRCLGCGACIPACPESVVALHHETTLPIPAVTILYEDDRVRCRSCRNILETSTFLDGLAARLTSLGFSGSMLESIYYCADCKGQQVQIVLERTNRQP
ncbi:MAG: 4Fe-4S dicluster domain-containing protein, partial [Sulfobacillus sp.]